MPESSILPAAPARLGRRGEEEEEEKAVLHFSSPSAGPGLPAAGSGEKEGGRGGQGGRFRRPLALSLALRSPTPSPPRRAGNGGWGSGGLECFRGSAPPSSILATRSPRGQPAWRPVRARAPRAPARPLIAAAHRDPVSPRQTSRSFAAIF
ncbi:unnamed protein product [Coccothraustes coccothraustes]